MVLRPDKTLAGRQREDRPKLASLVLTAIIGHHREADCSMLFSRLSHGRTRGSIGWRSADPIENRTVSSVPVFLSPQDLRPKPKVLDRRHSKTTFSETIGDTTTLPYDVPIAMLSTVQSDQFFADR